MPTPFRWTTFAFAAALASGLLSPAAPAAAAADSFHVEEATIADIQSAILAKKLTATELVKLYLARIKAYNGPGVEEPNGLLGKVNVIPHAKGINALCTLNLRPAARKEWGFDDHHARSMTDSVDNDPAMPDALETAARLDAEFAKTGKLVGPLHGVVVGVKDQYDTFDLRTTSGGDVPYANDRPPHDSTFVKKLRDAGAIIIGKTNLSEYADGTPRSTFGGTFVNAYDTTRHPNASSSGSGSAVAANLVTVAIAEESSSSVRGPAVAENCVGLAGTVELVSHVGMIGTGLHTRVGPIARTVEDAARIESVMAGYDPLDAMTAFNVGRTPKAPYESFTHATNLKGMRIGVVREYMDKDKFTQADEESIDIVDRAIEKLRELGATIIDPGPHGELFTKYIRHYGPVLHAEIYAKLHPDLFPIDESGKPTGDYINTFVDLYLDPSKAVGKFTLRDLGGAEWGGGFGGGAGAAAGRPGSGAGGETGPAASVGESRFQNNLYLRQRGDANVKSMTDWYTKATWYDDPRYPNRKSTLANGDKPRVMDTSFRLLRRFAVQEIVLNCFAENHLDAVVYPTSNLPPARLGEPAEPPLNGRSSLWTFLGQQGFPAMTVPAGFTTQVYDRELDKPAAPSEPGSEINPNAGPSHLIGPVAEVLPVGIDFLGRPFSEPTLFKIAGAYEHATHHRRPPPDFGPLPAGM